VSGCSLPYLPIEGALIVSLQFRTFKWFYQKCCGSGSGIRFFFYHWIWDPVVKKSGSGIGDEHTDEHIFKNLETIYWVKNT
jgi:hypothetical protein